MKGSSSTGHRPASEEIDERMTQAIGDRFVRHGDPRIPEILKGYALQGVAYWVFGESFCDDPDCSSQEQDSQERVQSPSSKRGWMLI